MAYDSFGQFVQALDKAGQLKRIPQPVATELEITELADREMKSPGGGKALLFEQPTVNGRVSPFPLAINAFGSHQRIALSLGASSVEDLAAQLGVLLKAKPPTSLAEAIKLLATALDLRHAKPKLVSKGACQEVVYREDQLSSGPPEPCPTLLSLPILKCWPLDAGRFITLPCVVTKDPDTGERNVGMYRMQIFDGQTAGLHWQLHKVAARHGRRYYESGRRMPVSVFLGGDPALTFCATAPLPDGLDEFLLAGYLRKKSVELVKCVSNDLEVPADADFVLEGYVDPAEPLRTRRPFRRPHRILFPGRFVSRLSPHRPDPSAGGSLSGHHRGDAADGGFLHGHSQRPALPAGLQNELPGNRRSGPSRRGRFP